MLNDTNQSPASAKIHGAFAPAISTSPYPVGPTTGALPSIVVDEPRRMLGPLAAWFHQEPSRSLDVYAVTGTNGKTSTAYLLDAGLVGAGHLTGMISGVDVRGPDGSRTARRTTPEASDVQRTLAGFVQGMVRTVTMEVSSHALALRRRRAPV